MKLRSRSKKLICLSVLAAAGIAGACYSYRIHGAQQEEILYKETQVKRGNLTSGVTESGSVEVGTFSQSLEKLEDVLGTSSSSSGGGTSAGSAQMGGSQSSAGSSDSLSGSSSGSSSDSLEVEEIYAAVGQKLSVGDALLKLSEESVEEYREQLEDAAEEAKLALQQANLNAKSEKLSAQGTYNLNIAGGNVAQSEYDVTIAELQSAVDSAQAAVDASAAKIAEYQEQIAKGKDMKAKLAEEQANYNSLVTKLASAKNTQAARTVEAQQKYEEAMLKYNNADSLYQIGTSGVDSDVSDAQEAYEDAQEALDNFNALIGDGVIYSQYEGTVSALGYSEGDVLSASTDVAVFADASEVTMTVSVSQEDISAVEIGDSVEIALTAYEDKTYEGKVKTVDTSSSSGTSTVSYNVTVVFTGDTSDVYQDMTGNVTFVASQAEDVLYVSRKAVTRDRNTAYVKVKRQDGTVEEIEVTTGISDGINTEISGDVEEGDTVLIESQVESK